MALAAGVAAALAVTAATPASAAIGPSSLTTPALAAASVPAVPAPANDERANAQVIRSLPAAINGTAST